LVAISKLVKAILIALPVALAVMAAVLFFHSHTVAILDPKGPVALQERNLIIFGSALSLVVVLPVFTMLGVFAWKYRATNTKARYSPEWDHNLAAETTWWLVPCALILILSIVTWRTSHTLDPSRALVSNVPPITIQVVALDWKWLFIYPQQDIATVNFIQFPVNTPVNFQITSDAPMNSFWIPQLGGQIYAMPGMSTQLHLMASSIGEFNGSSANISGVGFAGMKFVARSSSQADFNQWVKLVKTSSTSLSIDQFNNLAKPSQNNPTTYFSSGQPGLYDGLVMKYMAPTTGIALQ
jgi:cytochrome o ubiquinol oxidase subunit 2